MDMIKQAIVEWLREILVGGIVSNLSGMFDNVNQKVGEISGQVGTTPQAWNGGIYGYRHCQDDNIVARLTMQEDEKFIEGLEFAGAHAISGNGMSPAITNGRKAAKNVLDDMAKREACG